MPESPEVQALTEELRTRLIGWRIVALELEEFRALKTRGRRPAELEGATVTAVERRGKHIALVTDRGHLVLSFGRAGWARWADEATPGPEVAPLIAALIVADAAGHRRRLDLTDDADWLSFGLSIVDDLTDVPSIAGLGPDPAASEVTRSDVDRAVAGRRKQLKALLQEQETFAGIGNGYSDEILHAARLSPVTHASTLTDEERQRLYDSLSGVMTDAVAARRGVPIDQQKAAKTAAMRVHGRTGDPCPVCATTVEDVPRSRGGAQYCPGCQTGGALLT